MKFEVYRIAVVLGCASIVGLVFGYFLEVTLFAAIILLGWQVYSMNQLYLWVKNPNKHPLPDTSGQVHLLHRELNRSIQTNRVRKKQIASYLNQFRRAAAVLPDAIVLIDEYGKIQWSNRNAEKILGIRWPLDSDVRFTDLVRDPSLKDLLPSGASKKPEAKLSGLEFPSPVDRDQTLNIKAFPYSDNLSMIVARDVSRLVKVNSMHKDFVANVSHELKTPLTVLRGYLEILLGKMENPSGMNDIEAFAKPLQQMSLQSNRMQLIVDDLLFLSKLEDSQYQQPQQTFNLSTLINSILESLESKISDKELKLDLVLNQKILLHGNQNELYSAFSNLIVNAVNYTPNRGNVQIATTLNPDNTVSLQVVDDGIGIPVSQIPRLTERFYRVDDDRSREGGGTGLGLAIVKHVMQRHDANLEIDSVVGAGSKFICHFPSHRVFSEDENQQALSL